jgi:hypothetical protein
MIRKGSHVAWNHDGIPYVGEVVKVRHRNRGTRQSGIAVVRIDGTQQSKRVKVELLTDLDINPRSTREPSDEV